MGIGGVEVLLILVTAVVYLVIPVTTLIFLILVYSKLNQLEKFVKVLLERD
jgi:hypothetical protein